MAEDDNTQASQQSPTPNPDLISMDTLVGTWKIPGDAHGTITHECMEGGFFLVRHLDLDHSGHKIKGIEVIGHEQTFGAEPSAAIKTRVYGYLDGMTLDHVYEIENDELTIWAGEKGSPAHFKAKSSETGSWVYPNGGYSTVATAVKQARDKSSTVADLSKIRRLMS